MVANSLVEYHDSGLYWIKLYSLNHVMDNLRKFGMLSIFHSSSYENLSVHVKHYYKNSLKVRRTRDMETVIFPGKSYRIDLQYERERIGGKM